LFAVKWAKKSLFLLIDWQSLLYNNAQRFVGVVKLDIMKSIQRYVSKVLLWHYLIKQNLWTYSNPRFEKKWDDEDRFSFNEVSVSYLITKKKINAK